MSFFTTNSSMPRFFTRMTDIPRHWTEEFPYGSKNTYGSYRRNYKTIIIAKETFHNLNHVMQ